MHKKKRNLIANTAGIEGNQVRKAHRSVSRKRYTYQPILPVLAAALTGTRTASLP